jgi:DNA modification methylase
MRLQSDDFPDNAMKIKKRGMIAYRFLLQARRTLDKKKKYYAFCPFFMFSTFALFQLLRSFNFLLF